MCGAPRFDADPTWGLFSLVAPTSPLRASRLRFTKILVLGICGSKESRNLQRSAPSPQKKASPFTVSCFMFVAFGGTDDGHDHQDRTKRVQSRRHIYEHVSGPASLSNIFLGPGQTPCPPLFACSARSNPLTRQNQCSAPQECCLSARESVSCADFPFRHVIPSHLRRQPSCHSSWFQARSSIFLRNPVLIHRYQRQVGALSQHREIRRFDKNKDLLVVRSLTISFIIHCHLSQHLGIRWQ